jgi:hypothetical protein
MVGISLATTPRFVSFPFPSQDFPCTFLSVIVILSAGVSFARLTAYLIVLHFHPTSSIRRVPSISWVMVTMSEEGIKLEVLEGFLDRRF